MRWVLAHTIADLEIMEDQKMKYFGKAMALALVLGVITVCAVGCVGPESNDSGVNENTDTTNKTTTAPTTAPTTEKTTTQPGTSGGVVGSVADDVSEALTDGMTTQKETTQGTTQAPSRSNGRSLSGMRGREGK